MFMQFKATDVRDKVFGLLGIVEDRDDTVWQPDNTEPVQYLYQNVTERLVCKEQSLELLSNTEIGGRRALNRLQSWVPDFSVDNGTVAL